MKRIYLLSVKCLALLLMSSNNISAQFYNIGQQIIPSDVNNAGTVAASLGNVTHMLWTPTSSAATPIGTLSAGTLAGQTLVSNTGNVIVGSMTNPSTSLNEIASYDITTSTWTYLGGLVGSSDASKSSPWGISPDGTTIVGLGWVNAGEGHAVKWTSQGGMVDLGTTVPSRNSRANAISDDKSTIVGWQDSDTGFRQGAYWVDGTQHLITSTTGDLAGEAGAVSGDGQRIIGGIQFTPNVYTVGTGLEEITHPNGGMFYRGSATGISSDGNTVIGFYRPWPGGPYFGEGFIWTPSTGRVELNAYVASLGINTQGLILALPLAISPYGKKIVGAGRTPTNQVFGFYIDLTNFLGTKETSTEKNNISIFPIPTKDILNVKGVKENTAFEIYNAVGQIVMKDRINTSKGINVSSLNKGSYIIKLKDSKKDFTEKFIKE